MSTPITIVTAAQVRTVAQSLRYAAGVPVAYRCRSCGDWHPYDAPKRYDATDRAYHGLDCANAAYTGQIESLRLARWHATMAAKRAANRAA